MDAEHFRDLESQLERLLTMTRPSFDDSEMKEIRELLSAGEYGVALEQLTGYVAEKDKPFSAEALRLAEQAAAAMGMENDEVILALRHRIETSAGPGRAA